MKGAQILSMLDQGLRLSKPLRCPDSVYNVMQQCWNFEGVRRPTFAELVLTMSRISKVCPPSLPNSSLFEKQAGSSGGSGANSGTSDLAFF